MQPNHGQGGLDIVRLLAAVGGRERQDQVTLLKAVPATSAVPAAMQVAKLVSGTDP